MGKIKADGEVGFSPAIEAAMRIESAGIDLGGFFDNVGRDILVETAPELKVAEMGGIASGAFDVGLRDGRWQAGGRLALADGRIELADGAARMDSVSIDMPFDVHFPQEKSLEPVAFGTRDYGKAAIHDLKVGPIDIPSLNLDIALKHNGLSVRGPIDLSIFGGEVTIGAFEGRNMLGSEATAATSFSARNISLEEVTKKLGLPEVAGTFGADMPKISLSLESIGADGSAAASVFDGTVTMTSLGVDMPLSSVRTFKADLDFRGIDLSTVTRVLDFGSISGIMEGTLTGFEMSQGQPAALIADFQTVERKGVRQRINFDAVENITILGTGQGFQIGLGRGFASFFEDFGYNTIGFYCTLKNDNFRMKGKVMRGETEYFVKGVTIGPQINVINRNPGQTISFKSMLERINRISTKEESIGP